MEDSRAPTRTLKIVKDEIARQDIEIMAAEKEKARLWKLQGRYFHRFLDDYPTFREGELMRGFYQRLWQRTMKEMDWVEEKIVKMSCELETLKAEAKTILETGTA